MQWNIRNGTRVCPSPNGQRSLAVFGSFLSSPMLLVNGEEMKERNRGVFDHKTPLVAFFVVTWSRRSILPEVSLKVKEV